MQTGPQTQLVRLKMDMALAVMSIYHCVLSQEDSFKPSSEYTNRIIYGQMKRTLDFVSEHLHFPPVIFNDLVLLLYNSSCYLNLQREKKI